MSRKRFVESATERQKDSDESFWDSRAKHAPLLKRRFFSL